MRRMRLVGRWEALENDKSNQGTFGVVLGCHCSCSIDFSGVSKLEDAMHSRFNTRSTRLLFLGIRVALIKASR